MGMECKKEAILVSVFWMAETIHSIVKQLYSNKKIFLIK